MRVIRPVNEIRRGVILPGVWLLIFLGFLTPVEPFASPQATDPRDRRSLLHLYNATNGPNWNINSGWGIGDPCEFPLWAGIACTSGDEFIAHLTLSGFGLDGTIPPQVGGLGSLLELSLNQNQLRGEIPSELINLRFLTLLNLSSNQLTGTIPDAIVQLRSLSIGGLRLSFNGLYTDDPLVDAFLDKKSRSDWSATQTVPPSDIQAVTLPDGGIELSWQPIEFTDLIGRYRVAISLQPGGPYEDAGTTPDKLTTTLRLTDLLPDTKYYTVVFSETDPHTQNLKKIVSKASAEIEIQSPAQVADFVINPGLSGAWFNAETPGQGFFIDVFPQAGGLFVGWFTFDQESPPAGSQAVVGSPGHRWLTAQGPYQGNTANLTVNLTTGGFFDEAGTVDTNPVGTIELRFDDCENASIIYQLETPPVSDKMSLIRIDDSNVEFCAALVDESGGSAE